MLRVGFGLGSPAPIERNFSILRLFWATGALFLGCLVLVVPAAAQRDMGTLLGSVTDPSGAAIPGATITITEEATGVTDVVESDVVGNYIHPLIKPGV